VCLVARGIDAPEHEDRVADRRERIPELVREHAEKLVLPTVGVAELRSASCSSWTRCSSRRAWRSSCRKTSTLLPEHALVERLV
jgi:hypothetical protein